MCFFSLSCQPITLTIKIQEQYSRRLCSSSAYAHPQVFHASPQFHSFLSKCILFLYIPQKSQTAFLPLFFISKDRQSPNTAEYKEQKKREKQRLEREKKEQKERERKDNEMRKKFKVCSSKSPLFNVLLSVEINY